MGAGAAARARMGGGGDAAPTGGSGGAGGAGAAARARGGSSSGGTATKKKSKKGFFGIDLPDLPKVFGVDLPNLPAVGVSLAEDNPLVQGRNMVVGAGPALARFGGGILSEGARQHGGERQGLLDRLLRPAPGTKSTVPLFDPAERAKFREESPISYELMTSPARTARQVPDTLAAIRPGGPGFGKSDLGRQIADEGYLSTLLAKGGDIALLAGGAGLLAQAGTKGGGLIGQASRLERVAKASSEAAGLGKVPDEFRLAEAAMAADKAGDTARAVDLARAADQVAQAGRLRDVVAQSGRGTRAAGKVAEVGGKVARGFDRASALPFLPTQYLVGKAGKGVALAGRAAARSERVAPLIERAQASLGRLRDRQQVGDIYHESVRAPFEASMHNWYERHGLQDVAKSLSRDEQAAVYMARMTREALDPAVRELLDVIDELPDEVRPDAIRELFPDGDVTPEQVRLARAFEEGTLDAKQQARLQDAAERIGGAQAQRQAERYTTGRGTSQPLSEAALEARRQRARGEQATMDVEGQKDRRTAATRSRLAAIRDEMDELNMAPDPEPVPMSRAQERQAARLAERVRRAEATVKGETERGQRVMEGAGREMDRTGRRAANRTGQVIGRGRARLEEAGQLQTGVEARARQAALKERRLARAAEKAEKKAAALPDDAPAPKTETPAPAAEAKPITLNSARLELERNPELRAQAEGLAKFRHRTLEPGSDSFEVAVRRAAKDLLELEQKRATAPAAAKPEPKLSRKAKTEGTAAVKRAAADEAAAEAAKLKGVKSPDMTAVRRNINLDAQRAHTASKVEGDTASRILAKQVEDQRAAVARAQKKLETAQSQERATRDRFERENQARADRAQQKRYETLEKREQAALERLAKETEEAINAVESAPPQDRPALRVNQRAKQLAMNLAEAHPDRATEFTALADDIAGTSEQLRARGIDPEYIFGGPELGDAPSVPRTAKLKGPKRLQSERQRVKGTLARSVKAQGEKYAAETRDILHNEFRGRLQEQMGGTAGERVEIPRFASGEDIARRLSDEGLVAWDPKTGKALDPADIDRNSAVLPKGVYDSATKWQVLPDPDSAKAKALALYDRATGGWKHSVLALSPRWHVGNIVGNATLATLGAGLSPFDVARYSREARKLVKAFEDGGDVPPQHQAALARILAAGFHNPDLAKIENARHVFKLINKSYEFNSYVDSVNRTMIYLAKKEKGFSADAAVSMALKAAGDFSKMTPFERNVVRRIVPFYAWQRHITRLAFSLPVEHPTRVLWTLHLAEVQNRLDPDPGADNEFNEGTIPFMGKRLNVRQFFPFSSSFWADPTYRGAGYQVNPILKTGVAAATGFNLGKMKPVSGKFRGKNPSGFGAPVKYLPPGVLGEYILAQFPQVTTARDLVAGDAPVRYDTGEPRKVGKGASKKNAKPTLTGRGRKETVARFLGIPIPEPEQKATKSRK